MPVLRSTFIALSRNPALRGFSESSSVGRRMSSRFVAGLEVDDVLRAAESVNSQGISATLDSLGENVATPDEARHSAGASTTGCWTTSRAVASTPTSASNSPRWVSNSIPN